MDPRNKPIERTLAVAAPTAGTDFSITPDSAAGWLFTTLRFQFNTDANASTREFAFVVSDSDGEYLRVGTPQQQIASQSREYSAVQGCSMIVATLPVRSIDWPPVGVWVPAGHTLASVVNGIQAGDAFANIRARIIEFPTGPTFFSWPFPYFLTEESS